MKETPTRAHVPTVKPPGLHNDFSEQEAEMKASAMPPKFALTASAAPPPTDDSNANGLTPQQQADLERLGLSGDEIEALPYPNAVQILAASTRFAPQEWQQLWPTVKRLGLVSQIATILADFYEKGDWLTSPDAVSLAMLEGFSYTNADGKKMGGFLELAQEGDRVGIRAVIPYDDFGKTIILNPKKTTTVLGRAVDAAKHPDGFKGAMNMPIGTNYTRFQKGSKVGENQGGTNVLDIADWSWAKNNAWLQAAVDRGDTIRFISDPLLPSTLFRDGKLIDGGMTVTGLELGVLLNKGLAPDRGSGNVANFSKSDLLLHPVHWQKVKKEVVEKGHLKDIDMEAYKRFLYRSESPDLSPKVAKDGNGNVIEFQSNFFGGTPREMVSA
ncbi:MAG: hypothetical protein RLZZ519_2213 [Bacteroidota bacterium]|jgi:hypothetical protein